MVCGSALITSSRPLHTWQCIGLSCVLFTIVLQHESLVFIVSASTYVRCFFFFFQAEDGIRDIGVTGVQTCALPIFIAAVADHPITATPGTAHALRPAMLAHQREALGVVQPRNTGWALFRSCNS